MRRRIKAAHVEPTINLTPLIDVVFVILIVFLVAAPLLELEEVAIPQAAPHDVSHTRSVQSSSPVTVFVKRDDSIWLSDRAYQPEELIAALRMARAQHPGVAPQLIQDRRSQFGTYQAVKNAFEQAGYSELELILRPGD